MDLAAYAASLPARPLALDAPRASPYRALRELLEAAVVAGEGARPVDLGASVEGRPLVAFDVGPAEAKRAVVVVAGLHAMEWIGVEIGLALLARLGAAPPSDRRVRFHFLANPDGYARVEAGLRGGRRRFDRTNARGVDLNRNWPTHWKRTHWRAKALPFLGDGGPAPRSEPEVEAICRGLAALTGAGARIERALSLHSFGGKVLYPYGGVWRRTADQERHAREARWLAQGLGYGATQCARWVPGAFAPGMEIDHLYEAFGALSLLVECSRGGLSAWDPSSWLWPFRWFNPRDREGVVRAAAGPLEAFLRG